MLVCVLGCFFWLLGCFCGFVWLWVEGFSSRVLHWAMLVSAGCGCGCMLKPPKDSRVGQVAGGVCSTASKVYVVNCFFWRSGLPEF